MGVLLCDLCWLNWCVRSLLHG